MFSNTNLLWSRRVTLICKFLVMWIFFWVGEKKERMLICDVVWRILQWDIVHKTALRCTSLRVRYRQCYMKYTLFFRWTDKNFTIKNSKNLLEKSRDTADKVLEKWGKPERRHNVTFLLNISVRGGARICLKGGGGGWSQLKRGVSKPKINGWQVSESTSYITNFGFYLHKFQNLWYFLDIFKESGFIEENFRKF